MTAATHEQSYTSTCITRTGGVTFYRRGLHAGPWVTAICMGVVITYSTFDICISHRF